MSRRHCHHLNTFNTYMNTKQDTLLTTSREMLFIGFCQIFMYKANKFSFVEDCDAERSDLIFLTHFSKEFMGSEKRPRGFVRELIKDPKFIKLSEKDFVIHLGEPKKNWKGRTTKLFI